MNKFGENLKKFRKEQGLTQKDLAEILDSSNTTIYRLERGVRNPKYSFLEKLLNNFPDLDLLKLIGMEI